MKLSAINTNNLILPGVAIFGLLTFFYLKKRKKSSEQMPKGEDTKKQLPAQKKGFVSEKEVINSLQQIKNVYGLPMAKNIEKIFRNETAHFSSQQFKNGFSAGQEVHDDKYPYGWTSMQPTWEQYPQYAPIGFYKTIENSNKLRASKGAKVFIKYPSVYASMLSLAEYLEKYPTGRWFSTLPAEQKKYDKILASIKPRYSLMLA